MIITRCYIAKILVLRGISINHLIKGGIVSSVPTGSLIVITINAVLVTCFGKKEQLHCLNSPAFTIGDHFSQERGTFMSQGEFFWHFTKSSFPPLVLGCHYIKKCNHGSG